jgi:hypothetical protein
MSHAEEYGDDGLDVVVDQPTGFKCILCDKTYQAKKVVARHFDDVHASPIKCPQCDRMIVGKRKLRAHLERDHQAGSSS